MNALLEKQMSAHVNLHPCLCMVDLEGGERSTDHLMPEWSEKISNKKNVLTIIESKSPQQPTKACAE